jgi:hypothetical protein
MRGFAAFLAICAAATTAEAAKYDIWVGHDGITNISAVITTSDTLNAVGGHDVIGIQGNTTWGPITQLISNPAQPYTANYWPDGHVTIPYQLGSEWPFDNVLFDNGGPWFTENGILFQTSSVVWNLAIYRGQDYLGISGLGIFNASEWKIPFRITRIATANVPESGSWILMIGGLGMAGAAMRRRRTAISFA